MLERLKLWINSFSRAPKIIVSIILSTACVVLISTQSETIWSRSQFFRLVILGIGVFLFGVLFFGALELLSSDFNGQYWPLVLLVLFILSGLFGYYWVQNIQGKLQSAIPVSWLGGKGAGLEFIAEIITFFAGLPIIVLSVIFILPRGFLYYEQDTITISPQSIRSLVFTIVFIGLSLMPLLHHPNFTDFDNTFWGRSELLGVNSRAKSHLGDRLINNAILINKKWFFNSHDAVMNDFQYTKPFSQNELKLIHKKLSGLEDYLAEKQIPLIIIIPPNKSTVFPELMPKEIPIIGAQSNLDQVIQYMENHGGPHIIDLRERFSKEKNSHQLYYRTDSHWTPYGAYLGYEAIINQVHEVIPEVEVFPYEAFKLEKRELSGDLSINLANLNISEDFFSIVPVKGHTIKERIYAQTGSDREYIRIVNSSNTSSPRLLMVRDSFSNDLIPYLSQNFSRSVYVVHELDRFLIESEKPQVVVIEYIERYLYRLMELPSF